MLPSLGCVTPTCVCTHTTPTHTHSLPLSFILCVHPLHPSHPPSSLHLFIHLSILLSLHPSSSLSFFFLCCCDSNSFSFPPVLSLFLLCLDYPGAMLRFPDVFPSVMNPGHVAYPSCPVVGLSFCMCLIASESLALVNSPLKTSGP